MKIPLVIAVWIALLPCGIRPIHGADPVAALPEGVKAVWDVSNAYHEVTPTRERVSLNGLWRWQPAIAPAATTAQPPEGGWGFFKVPGCWPGITDYMQKDSQTVFTHPDWSGTRLGEVRSAWYQRTMTVPEGWAGRRIILRLDQLNSLATVWIDDQPAGEVRFPGGRLDLSPHVRPGGTHRLSVLVAALPMKGVLLSYTDSAAAREVAGNVARRGLCGDAWLLSEPDGPRLTDVRTETSFRKRRIVLNAGLEGIPMEGRFRLRARITSMGEPAREFESPEFGSAGLARGRLAFGDDWMPARLWDLDTPENVCVLELSLMNGRGLEVDRFHPVRFGFREFWIDGRDFVLNGIPIHLSALPFDNAQVGAAAAAYAGARESLERLKAFGINYVYTHNYDCEPGSHLAFAEILRAADDVGMLVGLTLPHFSHFDWRSPESDVTNGYARVAGWYVGQAGDHPSVVMYPMSHNATGYMEDMNPDLIDGEHDVRDNWAQRNVTMARRAEGIATGLDPTRIVYHHASGNLGPMHNMNFYVNFTPVQEMSDWFGHWATNGIKPAFTCEYGVPFTWDWTMYRGWYRGEREFGSARVPWEFCLAEWNAQFLGDRAYRIGEAERANLRWEARQFAAGNVWHRWDYPSPVGSQRFDDRFEVFAEYLTDNWRAFRTWGVSGTSPWEHEHFWRLKPGVDRSRRQLAVDWENLQRPGFSPDYLDRRYERMDLAFERTDWEATPAAEALVRNNRPLLAYIGGKPDRFTSKDHNVLPGESFEKQFILINDSRRRQSAELKWSFSAMQSVAGNRVVTVPAGGQVRIPAGFTVPREQPAGRLELRMRARFGSGEVQEDVFQIDVLTSPRPAVPSVARIAVFDPPGNTSRLLRELGVAFRPVDAVADLGAFDLLIVGSKALTVSGVAPDLSRVRYGLKVIVFEQTSEVLEKRLGFRATEYGLRRVFARVPDHPALAGLTAAHWQDWRGESVLTPGRLAYESRPRHGPTVRWCDIPVTRAWRCGNQGNVASVLIEKPARGDFLPILDGGFGQQFSPLLEYREGDGMLVFCQLDVTGRTEREPVADVVVHNLIRHVAAWKPTATQSAVYVGDPAGLAHLQSAGFDIDGLEGGSVPDVGLLVIGPGGAGKVSGLPDRIQAMTEQGGRVLFLGTTAEDVRKALPFPVTLSEGEHISAWFEPSFRDSALAGAAAADVFLREPRVLPLVASGLTPVGDGVLAVHPSGSVVFCAISPWSFAGKSQSNLRRTFRRSACLASRLMANLGATSATPLLERFGSPVEAGTAPKRWLSGLYLDVPEEWDDPYRFFRW